MEKLKAKHNHKLTDILKVGIFGLILILPFLVFMPTAFYYGFNEHATAPTKQVENTTTIHMQQNVINGLPSSLEGWADNENNNLTYSNNKLTYENINNGDMNFSTTINFDYNANDIILFKINQLSIDDDQTIEFAIGEDVDEYTIGSSNVIGQVAFTQSLSNSYTFNYLAIFCYSYGEGNVYDCNKIQLFNLTQMFGAGNEPTIDEFNEMFPNDYYAVDSTATYEMPNGTYTTYTNISDSMSFAWTSMYDTNLFNWTKNSPFKTSINGMLNLFQIPQTSGIGLYFSYLITMVGIYVIFDIVIEVFKWITHLIGEK